MKKHITKFIICNIFVSTLLFSNCSKLAEIKIFRPAEINTLDIKNIAVGKFEVGQINLKFKTERNGVWKTKQVSLKENDKKSISRSVRARVVNLLTETPYFKVIFRDEFERVEDDPQIKQIVSVRGYKKENVDAVITGKIWLEIERTDGVDLNKENLEYFRPSRSGNSVGLNLSVDQVVWWPYKSTSATLGLEIKMIRLNPTEIVAATFETRTFSQKIGGRSVESFNQIGKSFNSNKNFSKNNDSIESSKNVLPSFEQIIGDLSLSIASGFVRRVSVTEKIVEYPIASGDFENSKILIEAGAYDLAIDQLQKATEKNPDPNDLYNLGLCFEAIGDYGLALTTYREAWQADPLNLLFAKGIGRIEKLQRENPKLKRQLESR